jgi:hypothetical protein
MNSADNDPSSRRLDEIEYDIVETRAALGRTLEELAHQLMPSPAHRLVQTGLDVAAGALGETGLTEGRDFVRANPIAAALIGCGAVLSLLGRSGGSDIEAAGAEGASAGSAGRASGSDGLRATISRHPALLAAIGLGAGALVATMLATARKAADDGSAGPRSEATEPHRVPPRRRFVHPADQDGLIRAH